MKIIAFLMALMVIAQSVMPCTDNPLSIANKLANANISDPGHNHEIPTSDVCSPFCQCSCCAGFFINHYVTAVSNISPFDSTAISAYLTFNTLDIPLPVWQPPQLV